MRDMSIGFWSLMVCLIIEIRSLLIFKVLEKLSMYIIWWWWWCVLICWNVGFIMKVDEVILWYVGLIVMNEGERFICNCLVWCSILILMIWFFIFMSRLLWWLGILGLEWMWWSNNISVLFLMLLFVIKMIMLRIFFFLWIGLVFGDCF